jgi:hypothetical protein
VTEVDTGSLDSFELAKVYVQQYRAVAGKHVSGELSECAVAVCRLLVQADRCPAGGF